MTRIDYDAEYNNRARVPEHPQIFERWARDAAAYRAGHANAELGLVFGQSPRQQIDLFWPVGSRDAPVALFIHGGYWRSMAPAEFSHLAAGANANGVAVALVGYDLCPTVKVAEIIGQVRAAARFLGHRLLRKLLAAGHSAGGHLTACLVATEWGRDDGLPADFITRGISISGLFDLAPMIETSMNQDLRLSAPDLAGVSPVRWPVPAGRTLDAWVGGDESNEFLRQSRLVAGDWSARGVNARYVEVPGANHFTVIDGLAAPESPLTRRLVELARQIA